jgi:hypothetical protein
MILFLNIFKKRKTAKIFPDEKNRNAFKKKKKKKKDSLNNRDIKKRKTQSI